MLGEEKIRVLLIEDDVDYARILEKQLEHHHRGKIDVEHVSYLKNGVSQVRRHPFDAVLLDLLLPDAKGLDGFKTLHRQAPHLPIIILTGLADEQTGLRAVKLGAQDYLIKDQTNSAALQRVIQFAIHRHENLSQWKQAWQDEYYRATHDPLTGLPNRALLQDRLTQMCHQASRYSFGLALLFIDFDRLKEVNDRWGHAAGDHLLKEMAQRFLTQLRESDTMARIGGDEFVIVLPRVQQEEEALRVARKLQKALTEPLLWKKQKIIGRISIGISLFPLHASTPHDLLQDADMAMYEAKRGKGDGIALYQKGTTSF